jgi:hypothetical protein
MYNDEDEEFVPKRPYDPPPVFKPHPDDPGGFNQWRPIESLFPEGDDESPPAVYAAKFKSSSRQAEIFIHDPRNALLAQNAGFDDWDSGITSPLMELPERITTFVINHDATLAKKIIRAVATVDGTSVGITVHKEDDGS